MSKTNYPELYRDTNIQILYDKKRDTGYRVAGAFAIKPVHLKDELPEFQTTSNELYIEHGTVFDGPLNTLIQSGLLTHLGNIELPNQKTYAKYEFYRELMDDRSEDDEKAVNENDCLKFAESITSFVNLHKNAIIFNKQLQQDVGPSVLQYRDVLQHNPTNSRPKRRTSVKSTSPKSPQSFHFGDSDRKNRDLLKQVNPAKIDNDAIPDEGELYAIVRRRSTHDRSSYHIAYVIYSGDTINITIEAEADNETRYQPKFCLYDKNLLGNTFHRRWTGELYKDSDRANQLYENGRTVVLTMQPGIRTIEALFDKGTIPRGVRRQVTMPIPMSMSMSMPMPMPMSIFLRNTSSSTKRGTSRKRSSSRDSRMSSNPAKRNRSNKQPVL